ncbi:MULTISPECIES: hypothetical protein [Cupriavidus]|uniref:hypothetical protein n=1 Tax=Cupriavidus TaxID=106589 RepID=UPI00350F5FD4
MGRPRFVHGRSVDTSIGMTAPEGLVMGTRGGDLDPSVPGFVAHTLGLPLSKERQQPFLASLGGANPARRVTNVRPVSTPSRPHKATNSCRTTKNVRRTLLARASGR